jgi:hypothetical protein
MASRMSRRHLADMCLDLNKLNKGHNLGAGIATAREHPGSTKTRALAKTVWK